MNYRVVVDQSRCELNALCVATAPDIFQIGDDDVLRVIEPTPSEARRADVETAVQNCPAQAISIEEG